MVVIILSGCCTPLIPQQNSVLLMGASFSNPRLSNNFFIPVYHRGAFGQSDWTSGWANFNPDTIRASVRYMEISNRMNVYPNPIKNEFMVECMVEDMEVDT